MSYASPKSVEYSDDEMLDRMMGPDMMPPSYPTGLCFTLTKDTLEKIGVDGMKPGASMRFSAMGEVTSIFTHADDGCRIELELGMFAGPDGKFQEMESPAHVCLCDPEMEKMDLDNDAEKGDMIHLIGTARMESMAENDFADVASFQITEMTFGDESSESRG